MLDDTHVLTIPSHQLPFNVTLRGKVALYIASQLQRTPAEILPYIEAEMKCWGKLKWIGGDMTHARELVEFCEGRARDMSYVSVSVQCVIHGDASHVHNSTMFLKTYSMPVTVMSPCHGDRSSFTGSCDASSLSHWRHQPGWWTKAEPFYLP
jgi:hypothetical protein